MKPVFMLALLLVAALSTAEDRQPPLTDLPGRADRGEGVFVERELGHCVLCHQLAASDAPFQGNLGPPLDEVGSRLEPEEIRYRVVNIRRLTPDSIMPAYFWTEGRVRVAAAWQGKPILTAQQVEDVVAYLQAQVSP